MDFRILGSLEVWEGERQIEVSGPKRRAVLAFLVLHANEVVAVDRLVDQLWGEKAPGNAAGALQTHVSRLRKELGPEVLARQAWGYVLRIEPHALDLERFQGLTVEAESLPARERAAKLREALELWRGPPLADLAFEPALAADIARLEELHLTVLENRIDADLEAGNQAGLVGELEQLIADHPLRERLRGQLILALYRCGRQVEALEVYRETRRVLADELGLEPTPELRELERAILQQDPALRASPGSTVMVAESGVRPGRRRRIFIGSALALLLVVAGTAASYTLTTHSKQVMENHSTSTGDKSKTHQMKWASLEHATGRVVQGFAAELAAAGTSLAGVNAHRTASDARRVPLPDGGEFWVAPDPSGGFCDDELAGNPCDTARSFTINLTPGVGDARCGGVVHIRGHVNAKPGSRLLLAFSDGSVSPVPLVWIGPPINAGFFEAAIPAGKRMTALVLHKPGGGLAAILANKNKLIASLGLNARVPGQGPTRKKRPPQPCRAINPNSQNP